MNWKECSDPQPGRAQQLFCRQMLRPAHLEPGQWSRSFERTGHVAAVPNICPYKGTLSRLTKHSAISRQALEPALVGREGRGGSEERHQGSRPTAPPIRGATPLPSLKPPSPPAIPRLHTAAAWGLHALLPPFPKLSPSPHPGEEQGAEDGRSSKDRSKSDPTQAPGRDRYTEELLLPGQGDTAPQSPTSP